jgi:hypothetical protein
VELMRTVVLLGAQGWSRLREVDWLRHDPALRLAVVRSLKDVAVSL